MDSRFPSRDVLEGLRFTFRSDQTAHDRVPQDDDDDDDEDEDTSGGSGGQGRAQLPFGETPMTDPRSLGSSALVHLLLLLAASLMVLHAALPSLAERPAAIRGEIEPVDNRAEKGKAAGEGGGSPGQIGGMGSIAFVAPASGSNPRGPGLDPAADALLNEILPSTVQLPADVVQRALPGPQTTGVGLVPGSGIGGGGGSGDGSGGGHGHGIGPGTEFFGAREQGHSFAYVIDCSGSMATRNALEVAKRELLASLNRLPPDARFAVIFYNLRARVFTDPGGRQGLMPATSVNKTRVENQLRTVSADGGTDHMIALKTALGLKPEVVFFLTDADLITNNDVNEVLADAGGSRIQAVEFGRGTDLGMQTPLRRMASTTGGTYRYIDVTKFPASPAGY